MSNSAHSWLTNSTIDVKKVFYVFFIIFIKNTFFNVFYFWNVFHFLVGNFLILLNLLNSYIKRLLSDGINMPAIWNSLMKKSHSSQTLSCTLQDTIQDSSF